MKIVHFTSAPMDNNTFLVIDEATQMAALIDPSFDTEAMLPEIEKAGVTLQYLLNTHAHFDHSVGNRPVLERFPKALFGLHRAALPQLQRLPDTLSHFGFDSISSPEPHFWLEDEKPVVLGESELNCLLTPGHAPGHITFTFDDVAIVGDCLFRNSIGRTDIPDSSYQELMHSIRTRLLTLPDETQVLPGHGGFTTIGQERKSNPHLREIV